MVQQLNIDRLQVERGGRLVIAGLSTSVPAGRALLVTGPNGSGKTTLLRTIAGFLLPLSGAIALRGAPADMALAEQCHYIGMSDALKSNLTVIENLDFWGGFLGSEGTHPAEALETMQLSALSDVPAGYLSAGQRRRLAMARLLVASRPLWLLDEPTVALDAGGTALVAALIENHLRSGGIAVVATHVPLALTTVTELSLTPSRSNYASEAGL